MRVKGSSVPFRSVPLGLMGNCGGSLGHTLQPEGDMAHTHTWQGASGVGPCVWPYVWPTNSFIFARCRRRRRRRLAPAGAADGQHY